MSTIVRAPLTGPAVFRHPVFRRDYRFIPRHWIWNWSIPKNYILIAERVGGAREQP